MISKYSGRKPTLLFCSTRRGTVDAAKVLSEVWKSQGAHKAWDNQFLNISMCKDKVLKDCLSAGVGFHHAGLAFDDRSIVEKIFHQGQLPVLCCTSTLATGVNLPARLVIIRNTMGWVENKHDELSEISILQMIGRAGRPQFDDQGVAVIMTRNEKVDKYHNFLNGMELIESCLNKNLLEHMSSEICLGTIRDSQSALEWLKSSFLYIRVQKNPEYYGYRKDDNLEKKFTELCDESIEKLKQMQLIQENNHGLVSTVYGEASARYHVKIETTRNFTLLPSNASTKELLVALSKAEEFANFRLKHGEKGFYNTINGFECIRFPFEGKIEKTDQKICLLLQMELNKESVPLNQITKQKDAYSQMMQDRFLIFRDVVRICKCMIDCLHELNGALGIKHGLKLLQNFNCRCWSDSHFMLRQIPNIGEQYCRILASKGITTFSQLQRTGASQLELWFNRKPPFGMQVLKECSIFPQFQLQIETPGVSIGLCYVLI